MATNSYPDWVLKHKSKGIYVTKKKDVYYLYRAHSQRVKGTNKVQRIFDGYIGRVTEKEGFIPTKDKIEGAIIVYDFGVYVFTYSLCSTIYSSFKKSHRSYADTIFATAIFDFLDYDISSFESSGLSLLLKRFSSKHLNNPIVLSEAKRCSSMIAHYVSSKVDPDDFILIQKDFPLLHVVYVNDTYRLSFIPSTVEEMLLKYNVEVHSYAKSF